MSLIEAMGMGKKQGGSKLILHLGLHKTGTSAIQRSMFQNKDKLRNIGIYYPSSEPFEAHHALASRIKTDRSHSANVSDVERTFGSWAEPGYRTVVVSSEMFSEGIDINSLRCLKKIFSEVSVVFYVRRQDLLLESAYGQLVKQNNEFRRISEFKPYLTNIYAHIKHFEQAIEPDKIIVRNFDASYLYNEDVSVDFFKTILNIESMDEFIFPGKVNRSLSLVGLEMVRKLNSRHKIFDQKTVIKDVINLCKKQGGEYIVPVVGHLYSAMDRENLFSEVAESNLKLSDSYQMKFEIYSHTEEFICDKRIDILANKLMMELLIQHYS